MITRFRIFESNKELKVGDLVKYLRDPDGIYRITYVSGTARNGTSFYNIKAEDQDCSSEKHLLVSSIRHLTNQERQEWKLKKAMRKYNL